MSAEEDVSTGFIPGLLDLAGRGAVADLDEALGLTTGAQSTDDIDPMACDVGALCFESEVSRKGMGRKHSVRILREKQQECTAVFWQNNLTYTCWGLRPQ